MPKPVASWISRFAQHLLQVQPELQPLDAVRSASSAFADSAQLPPEAAAEAYYASIRPTSRQQAGNGHGAQA
ncbi:MAG: hypothetical protein V4750_00830 [Pseudomonadota bacterium]